MTDIATVRRKIGDRTKAQRDIATANGRDRVINLQYQNVFDVVVQVNEAEVTTGFTLQSEAGRIVFDTAPTEGVPIVVDYLYAAFTNQEITDLLESEGGVKGAVIACLEELTVDTARFYDFTQGETTEKRSQVFDNLMDLLESYRKQKAADDEAERRGSGMKMGRRTVKARRHREKGHYHPTYGSRNV